MVESNEVVWADWLALWPDLRKVLGRHCVDENEVDDIIQETYLRAALYGRNAPEGKAARAWLIRIAMNALADWKNRSGRYFSSSSEGMVAEELPSEEEQPIGEEELRIGRYSLGYEAARGLMRRTLRGFQGADRRILDSVYDKGHNKRATAVCCEIPEHLVKGRLYRARRRLGRAMRHRVALEHGV